MNLHYVLKTKLTQDMQPSVISWSMKRQENCRMSRNRSGVCLRSGRGGRSTGVIEWITQILGNQRTTEFRCYRRDVTLFLEALRQDQRTVRLSRYFIYATSCSSDLDLKTLLMPLIQITMFLFVEFIEIIANFYGGINYWLSLKFNRGAVLSMIQVISRSTQLFRFTCRLYSAKINLFCMVLSLLVLLFDCITWPL